MLIGYGRPTMKTANRLVASVVTAMAIAIGSMACNLPGSSSSTVASSPVSSPSATPTATPSATPTVSVQTSELEGIWATSCASTADFGSTAEYYIVQLSFTSTAFTLLTSYYSDSGCTSQTAWNYVTGTFTVGSATTSPSNGYMVTAVVGSGALINSKAASTATWLNGGAGCQYTGFNSNNGISLSGGAFTCTNDDRFDVPAAGTTSYIAIVYNTTTISTTAMLPNVLGVLSEGSVASTTSLTFDQE